jgi:small subunit ribosomal protein S8e
MLGGDFSASEKGDKDIDSKRTRGGNSKNVVRSAASVNVADGGEVENLEIQSVVDNEANTEFVRRSLLTKGAIVDTAKGKVRITSRPGQSGNVNGVLVEE